MNLKIIQLSDTTGMDRLNRFLSYTFLSAREQSCKYILLLHDFHDASSNKIQEMYIHNYCRFCKSKGLIIDYKKWNEITDAFLLGFNIEDRTVIQREQEINRMITIVQII